MDHPWWQKLPKKQLLNDSGPEADDTFSNDQHPNLKADFIMANPLFNLKAWRAALLVEAHLFFAPPEPIVWPSDLQALMPISAGLA